MLVTKVTNPTNNDKLGLCRPEIDSPTLPTSGQQISAELVVSGNCRPTFGQLDVCNPASIGYRGGYMSGRGR